KNRDEILAFLFIVLTGLSMVKYLDKSKMRSIVWIILLFTMAMLSKKSAYPMAIVLPVAFVLFQNLSRNQLILISLAVILPAAIVGSELSMTRMLLMIILPVIGIGLTYLIKTQILVKRTVFNIKKFLSLTIVPLLLILAVITWSFYSTNFYGLLLTLPLLFWIINLNFQVGLITLVIISFAINYQFDYREFRTLYVLIILACVFYFTNQKERKSYSKQFYFFWTSLIITSLTFFIIEAHESINIL